MDWEGPKVVSAKDQCRVKVDLLCRPDNEVQARTR